MRVRPLLFDRAGEDEYDYGDNGVDEEGDDDVGDHDDDDDGRG